MKKIIKYIDCDGVILDTETGLFDEYNRLKKENVGIKRSTYLQQLNWREWLRQAAIINDSISILKEHEPDDIAILTKVHSLYEASAKIEYFRELGLKNNVFFVPSDLDKSSIVNPTGHILVDDGLKNLDDWSAHNGISLFFNAKGINESTFDEQTKTNEKYPLITTLEDVFSEETEEYCKRLLLKR